MKLVSSLYMMLFGACLALATIHFRFWWTERSRRDYLAFALSCIFIAIFAWYELSMMQSVTTTEYLFYAWWSFLFGSFFLFTVAWFAYINLQGRRWLFWTFCASRALALILHLYFTNGINFREIISLGHINFWGESLAYQISAPNPWMMVAQASHILLVIFCIDSSFRAWRRGERRAAVVFGTGVVLFGLTILIVSVLVLWGFIGLPVVASFSILFITVAMVEYLNHELHSTAMLSNKLIERETELKETLQQLNLSAGAANVGLWTRKLGEDKLWINEKAGEIWAFQDNEHFTREDFLQSIHPGDRNRVLTTIKDLENEKNEFDLEYRIIRKDGNVRWVSSKGKVDQNGKTRVVRGAIIDITSRKIAEEAIHELSRRLISAQERERARLARELHDDLSQSLALLAIQLSQISKDSVDVDNLDDQIDQLVAAIAQLSADVHRISHELHPAKLGQLGLELALRGFCRELSAVHPIRIDFNAEDLPRSLPEDVSLCLYRVTQESLQNVMKHSGAAEAQVRIKAENDEIRLTISDNGAGFDSQTARSKESLGLISIDERVRALNGTVTIISAVGAGTTIEVQVPFRSPA